MLGKLALLAAVAAASRPNVILMVPDEVTAEALGVYGHPFVETPNLARLAASGTLFKNAFTTYPVCTQSRSSFLTARYTHTGGHRTLWDPLRYYEPNLLHYAKNASYEVLWFGKNDALDLPSFNFSVSRSGGSGAGNNGGSLFNDTSDPRYYSFIGAPPTFGPDESSDATNVQDLINYLLARNASAPAEQSEFFAFLPTIGSHPIYGCPRPYFDMYANRTFDLRPPGLPNKPDFHDRIRFYRNITRWPNETEHLQMVAWQYAGCVSYVDYVVGKLLDALDALGLSDNTALIFTSDHGDYYGNYGLVEKWPSGLEDTLVRVPFIARVPGGVAGQVSDGLIQHMDLVPTLLDVMGVPAQHAHQGLSLLPLLQGQVPPDDTGRDAVFAEGGYSKALEPMDLEGDCADPIRAAGDCDATGIYCPKAYQEWNEPLTVCRSVMVRTATHKLIQRSDPLDPDHDSELYDLVADPLELNNLYGNASYTSVQASLQLRLLQWYVQTSDLVSLPYSAMPLTPGLNYEIPRSGTPNANWSAPVRP